MSKKQYILTKQDLYEFVNEDFIVEKQIVLTSSNQQCLQKSKHSQNCQNILNLNTKLNQQLSNLTSLKNNKLQASNLFIGQKREALAEKNQNKVNQRKIVSYQSSLYNKSNKRNSSAINSLNSAKNSTVKELKSVNQNVHEKTRVNNKQNHPTRDKRELASLFKQTKIEGIDLNNTQRTATIKKQIIPQCQFQLKRKNQENDVFINEKEDIKQSVDAIKQKNEFIKVLDIEISRLENQLFYKKECSKKLQMSLTERQQILEQRKHQIFHLYKQNTQLSDMLRDLQNLQKSKQQQATQIMQNLQQELKNQQIMRKLTEVQRDSQIKIRINLIKQIQTLNKKLTQKQSQLSEQKHRTDFFEEENKQITDAYEKLKKQFSQMLKIQQNNKLLNSMIQNNNDQTTRTILQTQKYRCSKCLKIMYGFEQSSEPLVKCHLNQKFKSHIKTYEQEIQYWKDEVSFLKTQSQHQIQNIKTVIQCTFEKTLLQKEYKFSEETAALKDTILIQEELISNYQKVISRKEKKEKKEMKNTIQMGRKRQKHQSQVVFNYQNLKNCKCKCQSKNSSKYNEKNCNESSISFSHSQEENNNDKISYLRDTKRQFQNLAFQESSQRQSQNIKNSSIQDIFSSRSSLSNSKISLTSLAEVQIII